MNQVGFIDETEIPLEFGDERRHVDIRFGIINHGVLDHDEDEGPRAIRLGVVGSPSTNEASLKWLEKCSEGVAAKETAQPNLFPRFPGFGEDSPFNAVIKCDDRSRRALSNHEITKLASATTPGDIVKQAVAL